jgi:hypothetical protein
MSGARGRIGLRASQAAPLTVVRAEARDAEPIDAEQLAKDLNLPLIKFARDFATSPEKSAEEIKFGVASASDLERVIKAWRLRRGDALV